MKTDLEKVLETEKDRESGKSDAITPKRSKISQKAVGFSRKGNVPSEISKAKAEIINKIWGIWGNKVIDKDKDIEKAIDLALKKGIELGKAQGYVEGYEHGEDSSFSEGELQGRAEAQQELIDKIEKNYKYKKEGGLFIIRISPPDWESLKKEVSK